ncbi:hypothetical protein BXQ17_03245 [Polaribacter sp. BM10]|uniref:hypothetical protein n=1 Tax=Polaribacter sp. BM10 TaxID=1529069 RepID=UPI00098A1EAD|nr:hypothetical protein [Polaribacter sp. BM10]AQS93151.1 hypothetical protein BXQ17_03245 [Polaribacter sp. BM10]
METELNIKQKSTVHRALELAKTPIIIALILTPIRFSLELLGLPDNAIFIIGLLWLTLGFAIYWGIKLYNEKHACLLLFLSLLIYSPISRFPVALLWWIDTNWEIGTHYGLYFNNFGQALLNHVGYGSLVQIIPGFLLGSITLAIMRTRKGAIRKTNTIENE